MKVIERLESMRDETALLKERLARLRQLPSQPVAQQDERCVPRGPTPEEREELRNVLDQHAGMHAELGKMLSAAGLQYGLTLEGSRVPLPESKAEDERNRYNQQLEVVLSEMIAKGASPDAVVRVRAHIELMVASLHR